MSSKLGEFELIARYLRSLVDDPNAFNLQDDAAVLDVPAGKQLVVSKDLLIAGSHFFPNDPPKLIAQKALRSNTSDLIAKGATPYRYSLGLAFPSAPDDIFMQAFVDGLAEDQEIYDCSLIGGDTTKSPSDLMISITAYGLCDAEAVVTRLGAMVGDSVFVTGTLGDSALGLWSRSNPNALPALGQEFKTYLDDAYLLPKPPIGIQNAISKYASASMDISDGLFSDLSHLCRTSDVSAILAQETIPLSDASLSVIQERPDLLTVALKGGDDYQCLVTVSAEHEKAFTRETSLNELSVTKIGVLTQLTDQFIRLTNNGKFIEGDFAGFTHF